MGKKYRDLVSQRSKAKRGARSVLNMMASWASDEGVCSKKIAGIAEETGMSVRGVQYAISALLELKEIEIIEPGIGRGNEPSYKLKHAEVAPFKETEKAQEPEEMVQDSPEKVQDCDVKGANAAFDTIYRSSIDQLDQREIDARTPSPIIPLAQPAFEEIKQQPNALGIKSVRVPVQFPADIVDPPSKQQLRIQVAQFHAPDPVPPRKRRVNIDSFHIDNSRFTDDGYIPTGTSLNAVEVYYERFCALEDQQRLTRPQEDDLVGACTDLVKLRAVIIAYSQTSYRARNIRLILDWYRTGIPNQGAKNGANFKSAATSTPAANERRALAPAATVGRNEAKKLFANHYLYASQDQTQ